MIFCLLVFIGLFVCFEFAVLFGKKVVKHSTTNVGNIIRKACGNRTSCSLQMESMHQNYKGMNSAHHNFPSETLSAAPPVCVRMRFYCEVIQKDTIVKD